jgi:hypothetical protein
MKLTIAYFLIKVKFKCLFTLNDAALTHPDKKPDDVPAKQRGFLATRRY